MDSETQPIYQESLNTPKANRVRSASHDPVRFSDHASPKPKNIEERHLVNNELFGLPTWKSHVQRRPLSERSSAVQGLYAQTPDIQYGRKVHFVTFWNIFWVILTSWPAAIAYGLFGCILTLTIFMWPLAKISFQLSRFMFWPFGSFINVSTSVYQSFNTPGASASSPVRSWIFRILFCIFVLPFHVVCAVIGWYGVVSIQMSKVNFSVIEAVLKHPLDISVSTTASIDVGRHPHLCVFSATNRYYYKYSFMNVNIMLVNLMTFVFVTIVMYYFIPSSPPLLVFFCALMSTIPLSYYIGSAVSSIAAQSTFAVGAVLNASFASIIEVILYYSSLKEGYHTLVRNAVIGTILGCILLLPGLSMIFGGLKFKNQRFNPTSAGVSSVLLMVAIAGAFTPTLFYRVYSTREFNCEECFVPATDHPSEAFQPMACTKCAMSSVDLEDDPVYFDSARPLMYICSIILPISYVIGLLFTLRTHTHIYEKSKRDEDSDSESTQDDSHGPEWSRTFGVSILLIATVLFALVAEALVGAVKPTLNALDIPEGFVGVTCIALVPNIAEMVNAVQFALQNRIDLSIEIGLAAAVQIALLEIPVLIGISALLTHHAGADEFTLIFEWVDVFAILISVVIINYISIDGRSNYFIGWSLTLIYVCMLAVYYYVPEVTHALAPVVSV